MKNTSLIMHLFYKDSSFYLLDKVSKFCKHDKLYLSLAQDAPHNNEIVEYAKKYYNKIVVNEEYNFGNDQYGLYKIFTKYVDEVDNYIFYFHDKHPSKLDWIDDLLDPFIKTDIDSKLLNNSNGIIVSNNSKYQLKLMNEMSLAKIGSELPHRNLITNIRAKQTLLWVRELQELLFKSTGILEEEYLNFEFTAGNMFCIKKTILQLSLHCIHDNFFEHGYRIDGNVEHGLERFYFYVNLCLKHNVLKIGDMNV
jgi:hypothetical protein